jgi:glyoxylase-like metal-dependent hydrolase (beta-lactamase superfamily II)
MNPEEVVGMGLAVRTLVVGRLETNCYLASCQETKEALVIDPGDDADVILGAIEQDRLTVRLIVDTHAHFDHVTANAAIQKATGAPIAIGRLDAGALSRPVQIAGLLMMGAASPPANRLLDDNEEIVVGKQTLRVLFTPGHTPGGISLYYAPAPLVFSGDSLFRMGIGRTDLWGGDYATLIHSIRTRLFTLPDNTIVYPGHGPATTIGEEKRTNPFVTGQGD